MNASTRIVVAGALSGGLVNGALWAVAENAWNAIGAAAAGVMTIGLGGHVEADLSTRYRWGCYGAIVGLLTGAVVGFGVSIFRREAGGLIAGTLSAVAVWILSVAVFAYVGGFRSFGDDSLLALAVLAFIATVTAGAFVGTMTDILLRRVGRGPEGRSAL